jgi:hypothetical protein
LTQKVKKKFKNAKICQLGNEIDVIHFDSM